MTQVDYQLEFFTTFISSPRQTCKLFTTLVIAFYQTDAMKVIILMCKCVTATRAAAYLSSS